MAWDINEVYLNNGSLIGSSVDRLVGVDWGRYNVYIARFSSTVTNVTFRMDHSGVQGGLEGEPIAYVCDSSDDYEGTDGIPSSYIDWFTIDSPRRVDVSDIDICYIVIKADSSLRTGLAHLYLDIGGGGGGDPYFTATGDSVNGRIIVNISNTSGLNYDSFTYYCSSVPAYTTSSTDHTFTGLNDGTYQISVRYTYNGNSYIIRSASDNVSEEIVIGGGGGGDNWRYTETSVIWDISSTTLAPYNLSHGVGQYFGITFARSGTAAIEVPLGANVDLFYTDSDYGYDPSDGYPYASSGGSKAESRRYHQFEVVSNTRYYVWIKGSTTSIDGGSNVAISISDSGGTGWRYTDDQSVHENVDTAFSEYVTLQLKVGSYFGVTFKNSGTVTFAFGGTPNAYLYVTAGYNGYNPTTGEPSGAIPGSGGTSLSTTVNAGTTYIVWVRGSTENVYGSVQVTVTPGGAAQQWLVSTISTTEISTGTVSIAFPLSAGYMYCIPIRFTQSCNARFYSAGGYNRVAWLTSSNNDIDRSTGIPYGTILESDTTGSGDFDFNYDAAAATYYLWVRSTSFNDTTRLAVYIEPRISGGGKVWIYTSSGWKRATPWIYTSSGWKQAAPWIYTSSGWKQTT